MAGWPFHKFMAVSRAYRLEQERHDRLMRRVRDGSGDDTVREWNDDHFTRPMD